jgi:hyperosmotically inducible periplasmic protein
MVMKRIPVFLVLLLFATSVLGAQDKAEKAPKAKPEAVDCSSVDDASLTADVKAKLAAAPSLKDVMVNVATNAGVVTLTGMAVKPTQKGTASLVAKRVKCVKKVDNRMTIEGSGTKKTAKPKS